MLLASEVSVRHSEGRFSWQREVSIAKKLFKSKKKDTLVLALGHMQRLPGGGGGDRELYNATRSRGAGGNDGSAGEEGRMGCALQTRCLRFGKSGGSIDSRVDACTLQRLDGCVSGTDRFSA